MWRMPPNLRHIPGAEIVALLQSQGFVVIRQKGSHVRLRIQQNEIIHAITIPLHREIDRGTLKSIVRSLQKCLTEEIIKKLFYTSQ